MQCAQESMRFFSDFFPLCFSPLVWIMCCCGLALVVPPSYETTLPASPRNLMQVRTALWCSCLPGTQWLRDSEYSLFAFLTFQCHMTPNDTQAVKVVCECPSSWKWFGDHSLPPWCLFLCDYLCGFQKHWWDSATVKWFSEPLIYYTFNNAFCIQI